MSNFTSPIRGSAGTGKTGGVFALTASLLDNVEYVGLVPSKGQVKSLKDSTGAKTIFTKEQFFKKLGINNVDYIAELNVAATATEEQKELIGKASDIFSGEYKMIVLDEFSLFSSAELELISTYAKIHGIIVVSAGDFKQNKKTLKHEHNGKYYVHSIDDCLTLNTPELLASLRASNVAKLMNATQLENVLLPVYDKLKENPTMSAAEISAELEAIRINFVYTRNEKGAVIAGEKLVHIDSNKSVLYDEIDRLLSTIPSDLEESVCVITDDKEFYSKYADDKRIVVMNTEESQGQEYDYVVLDISKEDAGYSSNTFMMLSSYYTAIERSRKATLIAHYPKNKVQFADSEYSRGANAIETDSKFIADMMDFYNKAFSWVNSVDDPEYEDGWYNEESEDGSDGSDDSDDEEDEEDDSSDEESVDNSEIEDDEDDSKKPKGKKKTTARKKPTPKKVKRTSTKTVKPKKTPVKRTTKKTSTGTSVGTYKPSANSAKLPIRINVEKIRTLLGTDKEFGIKFAINSLPKKSSIKTFLTSSDANYYYSALYWTCVRESLPDNWKSVFRPYGDETIITLLESVANKEYNVKTLKHNGDEINIITCSLLDAAGNVLVTIPITCVDNKPTKAQLQKIKG